MATKKTLRNRSARRKAAPKPVTKKPETTAELRERGRIPLFSNVSAAAAAELTDQLRAEGSRLIPPAPGVTIYRIYRCREPGELLTAELVRTCEAQGIAEAACRVEARREPGEYVVVRVSADEGETSIFAIDSTPKAATEPTFTLTQIAQVFGGNYSMPACTDRPADPLSVAMDVIEDLQSVIFVVNANVSGDCDGMGDLMNTAWNRANAALKVLDRFRIATLPKGAEVVV